ncbi:MAG TPA: peptidoglycan-binding protein, partial [Thermodesulfovibrionales bacterium]|nr:peptidoglycan-binding protein [Thermodesulfovibrionales bacterium]
SKEDVAAYVEHRLTVAGAREKLFETAAVDELYRLSQGIPRLINVICDRALLGAYVEGQKGVGKSTLLKAAREVIGERKAPRVILKWALTGSILIISVTALAATFYNRKIQLFSAKKMQVETSARSPEVQEISGLEWPADQPIRLSKETAYQALFREWNIPDEVRDRDTACKQVRGWGLECIDAKGDLNSLLDLNKPAVIKLSDREGREFYTVLTSIQGSAATVVMGAEVRRVNLDEVSRNWPGTFTFLWRAAPKYHRIVPGDRGAEVQWLERQMVLIQGDSKKPRKNRVFDDVLTRQVEAFQRSAGIRTDGIVGPETFIHLNTALSRREPALAQKDR